MIVHATGLLATLVIGLGAAFVCGALARLLRLPPIIGYLVAGVVVGPFTPGVIVDQSITVDLAEIGVAMLLFGVGLHFSPRDLFGSWRTVVPCGIVQITIATLLGFAVGRLVMGLEPVGALLVGVAVAIASTAVATRALEERGTLDSAPGRIALGWLVVQDIAVVLVLVFLPVATGRGGENLLSLFGTVVLQLIGFIAVVLLVGRRVVPRLLGWIARSGSRELFTLAVVVVALGIALGSAKLFGVSIALGAFFAGIVLGESDLNHQAAAEALPLQHVFSVLFFVAVGMLFDPAALIRVPTEIFGLLLAILIGTGFTTLVLLLIMRASVETAALVGGAFAQIGEFSFILTEIAVRGELLPVEARSIVLAAASISILLSPLSFRVAAAVAPRLAGWGPIGRLRQRGIVDPEPAPSHLEGHAILVGHGRVGRTVAEALRWHELGYVVIEGERRVAESLRKAGVHVIYGDATRELVLAAALPQTARLIVVALPDPYQARRVIELARALNPGIDTVVRTHSEEEALYLAEEAGVGLAVMGEREIALGMSDFSLQRLGVSSTEAQETIDRLRANGAGRSH